MAKTQTQDYEVQEGRTTLTFPGKEERIQVVHPFEGPDTYTEVGQGVLSKKLALPTAEQTAYLLHAAYCGPEEFRKRGQVAEVRNVMSNRYFWLFNRNLWTDKGVYVVSDPEAVGLSQELNADELEGKLSKSSPGSTLTSADGTIRFASKDSYELGEHTPESFSRDGFVVASFGQEAAEKLKDVADKFRYKPRTWGIEVSKGQEPIQRLSAVDDYGVGLGLGGLCRGGGGGVVLLGYFLKCRRHSQKTL